MRFRLLRRRLSLSGGIAVRNALPWPFRWALLALVLGFCAAISLWAFERGKELAGLDGGSRQELKQLRLEVSKLRDERDKAQSLSNVSENLIATERATQEALQTQLRRLENENRVLHNDLGFFEKLIPTQSGTDLAIRGLQIEKINDQQIRWQVLVMQPNKNPQEFKGELELLFRGTRAGKPWEITLPNGKQALQFKLYQRLEGTLDLPLDVLLQTVNAQVLANNKIRATEVHSLQRKN